LRKLQYVSWALSIEIDMTDDDVPVREVVVEPLSHNMYPFSGSVGDKASFASREYGTAGC
jgi:hypothetical protein